MNTDKLSENQFDIISNSQFDIDVGNIKNDHTRKVKSEVAVLFLQAKQLIQQKQESKQRQAYSLLVQIAELCMSIQNPDGQVNKWIQISCRYLTIIHRQLQLKKKAISNIQIQRSTQIMRQGLTLKYNKFTNEFLPDHRQKEFDDRDVKCYISKINSILFQSHNIIIGHSLRIILKSYWFPFSLIMILMVLTFIFLGISQSFSTIQISAISFQLQIPILILCLLLILPMLMIFCKNSGQTSNYFFKQKLDKIIKQINADCELRNKQLFFVAKGTQIKIKIKCEERNGNSVENEIALNDDISISTPSGQFSRAIGGFNFQISKLQQVNFDIFLYG